MEGISVIIPTYNREKFIDEAVQSVLYQDYKGNLEILVCDDGSTDNTLNILSRYGSKIKVITKEFHDNSQGVSSTRNRGIRAATQPWICFLDSDDFFLEGHLSNMATKMSQDPGTFFIFCRILELSEENNKRTLKPWTLKIVLSSDSQNPLYRSKIIHTNGLILKKEIFQKVGFFNEFLTNDEDSDMWFRISDNFQGQFSNHYGAIYRVSHSNDQLTKKPSSESQKYMLDMLKFKLNDPNYLKNISKLKKIQLKHTFLYAFYKKDYILKYRLKQIFLFSVSPRIWGYWSKVYLLTLLKKDRAFSKIIKSDKILKKYIS
ncbi:MAG: glycosyltransferase [Cyclobacteriaceae bacterium]